MLFYKICGIFGLSDEFKCTHSDFGMFFLPHSIMYKCNGYTKLIKLCKKIYCQFVYWELKKWCIRQFFQFQINSYPSWMRLKRTSALLWSNFFDESLWWSIYFMENRLNGIHSYIFKGWKKNNTLFLKKLRSIYGPSLLMFLFVLKHYFKKII